jgi:hypothetical protein
MPFSAKHRRYSSAPPKSPHLTGKAKVKQRQEIPNNSIIETKKAQNWRPQTPESRLPLILSGHQPTLMPYPGFFYKMFHSNIMDICPYDPFSNHSDTYQHRVKIGTDEKWRWFTLPVEFQTGSSIMEVKIKTHLMNERWALLEHVYEKYPMWEEYKNDLKSIFFGYNYLWEISFRLILWMRDLLHIKTYVSISWKGTGIDSTERISSQFSNYGPVLYLAGKSSSSYLNIKKYESETNSKVLLVTYTPPQPFATVTTLTPILMYPPNEVLQVLRINEGPISVLINGQETKVAKNSH